MITVDNFKKVLESLGFANENNIYTKHFETVDCDLKADFAKQKLIYPTEKGLEVNDGTTSNFAHPENFVVFECVARLLQKGYRPEHIELEPRWSLGHGGKSGKADICVKNKDNSPYLCIIECKTAGAEYKKELFNMKLDGGQLFSYWQQSKATKWLVLYASDFDTENQKITSEISTVNCSDDANIIELAKNDKTLKLYKDASTAKALFEVWKETYEQKFFGDIIFDDETVAYDIGVLPLKKKRLVDFSRDDKIVNQFEEILRHNNVSDKENAFNRLIALFIAKLYDEKTKTLESEVEFQYKTGTDTYQKMQDRLQKLHYKGMKEFMGEEVFYVADDYVKTVLENELEENREQLEAELNKTIKKLKFYTNNDFAFKDVHNEKLFYQNGKILVEMVELFQKYRIIDSNDLQLLGDMFEQLLNKGFKQNEGQFFTPIPITCFIWKCLPLESIILDEQKNEVRYPKVIDYACGAGHFLTEGFREINEKIRELGLKAEKGWERDCIFGIEKDYRLARVSKISMFMHGADNGNIVFGDGLDNHNEKIVIENGQFDILVANPPYSVSAFKNHLELKHNELKILGIISKDGKEIETLFVERIAQLLKPNGIAAVILPSSILSNSSTTYIKAREEILKNFAVHAIVQFGSKTFGATGTNTVALYLKKNSEPPVKSEIAKDNVNAIFENEELKITSDKNIFDSYCQKISVSKDEYLAFVKSVRNAEEYTQYKNHHYFGMYVKDFEESADFKKLKEDKLNKAFYDYALQIEKEKIYYFALVYKQQTLVVTAPSDNAEQEAFLGYSWSNRKGDEGIKIKSSTPQNSCGLLYNVYDEEHSIARYVKDTFFGIYRCFASAQHDNNLQTQHDNNLQTQHDNNLQTQHDNNLQTQRDNDLQTQRDNDSHAQYDSNLHLQHVDDTCHSEGAKATEESIIFTENQDATNAQGYIYIVTNKNKTTLYIGVTSNLIKRIYEHKNHVVEGFSDKYNCEYLVYFECFLNIKEAIEREKYLKGKKREFKENLINSINPGWIDLYDYICQRDVSATPQHDNNMQMQHDNNSHLKHDNTLYFGQTNCHSGQTNCHSGQTSCHSEQSEESILKYISVHSLKDMIDFSRTTFDKAIKTSVQAAAVQIESKFPMVKIKDICEIGRGKVMDKQFMESHKGIYPVYSSQTSNNGIMGSIDTYMFDGEYVTWTTDGIYAGTCFYRNGKFNCTNVCGTLKLKADKKDIAVAKFLPEVLNMVTPNYVVRVANPKLMNNVMAEVQITLPPLDVQTSIVAECEQIDAEYQNAQKEIADANKKISEIMETSLKNASDVYKLSNKDIFDVSIGRRILSTEINDNYDVPVYSANVFEPFGKINKLLIKDFSVPSVLWGIDGDWQVNVIAENQPFYPTDHCGVLRIKNNQLEPKFVAYTLEKAGQKEGFKRSYRASIDRIEGMNIKLPPLAEQQKIVAQITALEEKITAAKRTMTECPEKKQAVLDKWLK